MSLSLYFLQTREVEEASCNITHNLNKMAEALGVYELLWHPEKTPDMKAKNILPEINKAITELTINPEKYKEYEAPNGWGTISGMLRFLQKVRAACEEFPESRLEANI